MAEFFIELNDDNTIKRIVRDGVQHHSAVALELPSSVVTIYFQLANANLNRMRATEEHQDRRGLGVQAFLMCMTGLEAFANTYFHLRAWELKQPELEQRIKRSRSALAQKFREFIPLVVDTEVRDQEALLGRIFQFSILRNELMHPRWSRSSLTMLSDGPIIFDGLVENMQAQFEDYRFCNEALFWCLLVIARIAQASGKSDVSGFLFRWTGNYGVTLPRILQELGLQE